MPMPAARSLTASRHHGQRIPAAPAVESRIAAQRDVADAAHPPRFTHLAWANAPAEGRPGIIGLNGYISVMNKMKRGAEQDDPY